MPEDTTEARLASQIAWYDGRAAKNQRWYKNLKFTVIVISTAIPLLAGAQVPVPPILGLQNWLLGLLGAIIAVIEGVQQLNQYHGNWISYRSTCEALKHEKFLFIGNAGAYATAKNPQALLAERIESLVSQEHAKWASVQEAAGRTAGQGNGADGANASSASDPAGDASAVPGARREASASPATDATNAKP
jgi:hypothetical protein